MPSTAVEVLATSTRLFTPGNEPDVEVTIQNRGSESIFIETGGGAATVADGLEIAAGQAYTTGGRDVVEGIGETTAQTSPADTRVSVERRAR
jgi:hypothetical protein